MLMRDLSLPDFGFFRDTQKLKILVAGVPLADVGRGASWYIKDWTNDRVYDGLRNDLERSNPGIVCAGRPNILGSVHAMKEARLTKCSIRFMVEKNSAVDVVLRSSRVCLRGGNRVARLWVDHRPAHVCHNCMQLGHISTLCAFPPRCRLCRGNHKTLNHLCQARNCDGKQGESCEHTVRLCLLCEGSGHFTGHPSCPAVKMTPEVIPPPLRGSPMAGDAGARSGIADRSRNRENVR